MAVGSPGTPSAVPTWIKPMSMGGIVDRSLKVYRSAFGAFFAMAIIAQIPAFFSSLISHQTPWTGILAGIGKNVAAPTSPSGVGSLVAIFVLAILSMVFGLWITASLIHLGSERFLGKQTTLGEALKFGAENFLSVLWATIIYMLLMMGVFGVFAIVFAVGIPLMKTFGDAKLAWALAFAVGVFGLAVAITLFVNFLLYYQVLVVEGVKGLASLTRSRKLMRSERGFLNFKSNVTRVSVILLVVFVVQIVIVGISGLLPLLVRLGTLDMADTSTVLNLLSYGVGSLAQAFAYPISLLALTMFYYDIRIRKEGLDMQLRAATVTPPQPAVAGALSQPR